MKHIHAKHTSKATCRHSPNKDQMDEVLNILNKCEVMLLARDPNDQSDENSEEHLSDYSNASLHRECEAILGSINSSLEDVVYLVFV